MFSLAIFYRIWGNYYSVHFQLTSSPSWYPLITYPCPYFFFRSTLFPCTISLPFDIIWIVSDKHSAYSMLWVVIRTVRFTLIFNINFHVNILIWASIPVVGSSKIINFGSPIKLIAKDKRRLIPPENVDTLPFLLSYKLTDCRLFLMSLYYEGNPFNLQNISICCPAVNYSHKISNCGQTPITFLIATI